MPNYNGVWSLSTQYQYAATWSGDNISPATAAGFAYVMGGANASVSNITTIQKFDIASTGNASDFASLDTTREGIALASSTRGVIASDTTGSRSNEIKFFVLAAGGITQDFGDLTANTANEPGSAASSTRGLIMGGQGNSNTIDYITIATEGNAQDFGNLTIACKQTTGCASTTRAVRGNGIEASSPYFTNVMDYVTIANTGNAADFGDLTRKCQWARASSNSTRGLFAGGNNEGNSLSNVIEYITIANTGNSTDFGDLSAAKKNAGTATNSTRAVFAGGYTGSTGVNVIEYVTIGTTGNVTDFGDLTLGMADTRSTVSGSHGGIA